MHLGAGVGLQQHLVLLDGLGPFVVQGQAAGQFEANMGIVRRGGHGLFPRLYHPFGLIDKGPGASRFCIVSEVKVGIGPVNDDILVLRMPL